MTITLYARRNNSFVNPSWSLYEGDMQDASYFLSFRNNRAWFFEAIVDRRAFCPMENEALAENVIALLRSDMGLPEVLAIVRQHIEYQHQMYASEAEADRQTDLAVERFYENRMTDADKAQEDWEYANLS